KIGILSFAHHHAEAYIQNLRAIPGVEMIGIADEDPARGRHFADLFDTHLFPSYETLLAARPDGVIVCSENSKHRPLVEMAAQAGINILCEKPLATTLADAQAMIDICHEAGVHLMTAFPMRFSAPLQQLKEQLDTAALGQVYCLNTTNQGQMPIGHRSWFVDKKLAGGGALMDHIVHLADVLRWYLPGDVVSVYAQSNHILHADAVDVETGGLIMLTFADGAFATIDSSWSKPLNYPTWGGLTMELISERGLTVVDAYSQNLNVYQQEPSQHAWMYWGSDANQAMIEEFVAAIREQRRPLVTGEDGYKALEITLAAYESAASGQPVALS
ncbi:MAG: Gfo/Idh/MocA family oxidoreductase, partial [Chloroflexi bacterium]|nr:Gfo/Idh/MocA family oxidoreductase [Chloroflexota bacterium]